MIEILAHVGRKLGLFQIKPTPMICNLSQVSDQKIPNLDQVENLAGDFHFHFFCCPDAFLIWSSQTQDYELGLNLNILNPMDYMFLQQSLSNHFQIVHLKTLILNHEGTPYSRFVQARSQLSILVLIVLYCPGHVPSPMPYGHWSFTTRGGADWIFEL